MSRKTVNAKNLEALGAARLAALVLELSAGDAAVKRRVRLELTHAAGAGELVHEVRKRFATIGRSKGRLDWSKITAYLADLRTQLDMISERIAPEDPAGAFELTWQFLALAPSVHERLEDRHGELDDLCLHARVLLGTVAPAAMLDPERLADRVVEVISDDAHAVWSDLILHLGPALTEAGITRLRDRIAGIDSSDGPERPTASVQRRKVWRRQIADLQGDTDGFLAEFSAADLARPTAAAEAATRLIAADRADEALAILDTAQASASTFGHEAWDSAYVAALTALDRAADLQAYRWSCFKTMLSVRHLRDLLRAMPDFEDIEKEDAAKALAARHPDPDLALALFLAWPDREMAARLVLDRAEDLDGDKYDVLTPAAEALEAEHPLASILCRRAMIRWTLERERRSRYGYAARHLKTCEHVDRVLADYGDHADHATFLRDLRHVHGRKQAFWRRVN